jgi:hypothetical protein
MIDYYFTIREGPEVRQKLVEMLAGLEKEGFGWWGIRDQVGAVAASHAERQVTKKNGW